MEGAGVAGGSYNRAVVRRPKAWDDRSSWPLAFQNILPACRCRNRNERLEPVGHWALSPGGGHRSC